MGTVQGRANNLLTVAFRRTAFQLIGVHGGLQMRAERYA
jgi:hypothetical protein